MPQKPKPAKKTAAKKATARKPAAKKASPAAIKAHEEGVAAAPKAVAAAALTPGQKRNIVRACIEGCTNVSNFSDTTALKDILPGREQCVESCIIGAVHKPIIVVSTDTVNKLKNRI